jgi:two-component system cell cycle response regulator DivK
VNNVNVTNKILYIEDNAENRRLIEKVLRANGYEVLLAKNGLQGWEMFRIHEPKLILLDISLPGEIDGLEVAARVKQLYGVNHTWIIAITASAMVGDREYFLHNGCDDYMAKPIRISDLLDRVSKVFNRLS